MRDHYLYPGMQLWYCNRKTGNLGTVEVTRAYAGTFFIRYKGKEHELPMSALGTRLFFTRKGASCPKDILKEREATERDNDAFRSYSVLHRLAETDYDIDWDELLSPPEYE